jgi:simple sugar transport system substrate-binding protein
MLKNLIASGARALLALPALVAFLATANAADPPPLVVGFVYVTPIGEAGWTYQHELGRRELQQSLGRASGRSPSSRSPKVPTPSA